MEDKELQEQEEFSLEDIIREFSDHPIPKQEEVTEEVPAEEEASESAYAAEAAALKEELGVSDEVSQILAQAEDLIAHETPEPVVAPEPIEVTLPLPVEETEEEVTEETEEEALTETVEEEAGEEDHSDEEADSEEEPAQPKKKRSGWLIALISLVLLADLCIGGYLFYERYYLQTIYDMNLNGVEDKLTVSLNTTVDEELLTVYCTDTYGNTLKQSVENGKAVFEGLKSATSYKITVQISGLHKLIGETTGTHVTSEQTTIAGFTAATGSEDGSVILNFTIQGQDSSDWKVTYKADGEEEKSVTFSGHMVTINGLTVGSKYTFRLEPVKPLFLAGTDTVEYTATSIIYAEDLVIEGIQAGTLIASWKAPEGSSVKSWTVRCYNDTGYDKTITVEDTKVSFPDIDVASAYTIEVNATGMTMGIRGYVSANSVTVKSLRVNDSNHNQLSLSWEFDGTAPQGGWLILYSIDGSTEQQVVKCAETNGVIFPVVPGSHYAISIQSADGNTVFGGQTEFTAPEALSFSGYLLTAANMEFKMCKTPSIAEWTQYNVPAADYKTTYAIGENASFAVHLNHEYNTSADEIVTLFVIRDASGKIVSTATQSRTWTSMWYRGFGRINIPALPQSAGEYTLEVYFNSALAHTQSFSMA